MKLSQKGFGIVQVLLIIGILVIIGGAGYYVYKANNDVDRTLSSNKTEQTTKSSNATDNGSPKKPEVVVDPIKDWKTFVDPAGKYEFKHPATWAGPNDCGEGTVLFGANSASVGKCASDSTGQMAIFIFAADMRSELALTPPGYKDVKSEKIKISGLDADKYTGTFSSDSEAGIGPSGGDKIIRYMIFYGGVTYTINYYDLKSGSFPDVTADLQILVNKTFNFK